MIKTYKLFPIFHLMYQKHPKGYLEVEFNF